MKFLCGICEKSVDKSGCRVYSIIVRFISRRGSVWLERYIRDVEVVSSNLVASIDKPLAIANGFLYVIIELDRF